MCSLHFLDGRPTDQNPDPTLNLGYSPLYKQAKARKPPTARTPIEYPASKKQKVSEVEGVCSNTAQDVLLDTSKDLALGTQGSFSSRFNEASQDSNCANDKEIEELHQLTESHIDAKNKEMNELRQENKRLKDLLKKKNEQVKERKT